MLLTGALGGIGRHVARHLAARYQARLLLVGRSAAGAASEALIREIRAAGGDAHYYAADIADDAQAAAAAAAAALARFGALHAVVHSAGATRDQFLLHKTADDLAAVLAPKLAGTLALDRATANDPLDLFVCFSSLAGTFGNAGQTDYSAANRFLDAYMATRRGPGRSLAIGWPFWQDWRPVWSTRPSSTGAALPRPASAHSARKTDWRRSMLCLHAGRARSSSCRATARRSAG